ncbi:LysR family transcriptional regulator [Pseudoduganella namucuonensis]|uniref:Transcriptional regulator, LysR family n=1 Tax=Pseudoduganella namucuonensis TaxID=1035707 RepID=A0A1I7LI11_9BURK|nr:LysR family transcriptional regulator [Pseudoduganella namucuonensis]SFV09268.1 transcriptional regulator, LysR family [Pseudoduganella namucuonensis]
MDAATPTIIDPRWRVFLRVVASGSLSKAAAALDMPQSMVSRHIAQLERECGERLFRRTGRGVHLTEVGELLLPRIARLAEEADALADDVRSVRGQPVGEVLVGMLPSAVGQYAGALFAAAREQMPGVRLHLSEGASAQLDEHLREGRLDMAIVLREDEAHVDDGHVLARLPLQLVGRLGDPLLAGGDVPLAALADLPLIVPSRPHVLRARLDRLGVEHGLRLRAAVEVDSVRLQYEVAAVGGGYAIAIVPPAGLDPRLAACRIARPVLERYVVLAESPRRPRTRASREVLRLIRQLASRDMAG